MAGSYRAVADRSACCGYGVCAEICGDVYKLDEGGIVYIPEAIIPEGLLDDAREGADACPQNALKIVPAE